MLMRRSFFIVTLAGLLSGCATRGSLDIDCNGFTEALPEKSAFRQPLPLAPIEKQIKGMEDSLYPLADGQTESGLLTRTLYAYQQAEYRSKSLPPSLRAHDSDYTRPSILLLSGGGQWGAFGAGFMAGLAERGLVPNYFSVTGVSTGSMQAMFVGAKDDPRKWERLIEAYTIYSEKELVNRNSKWRAAITGSFAGLSPLRKRIEQRLCPEPGKTNGPLSCPALEALRDTDRQVLVGYIEASTGDFFYSDLHHIAHDSDPMNARSCIAATALASSAMPVTFQQVRINRHAYYDGGVRQSVFGAFAEQIGRLVRTYQTKGRADGIDDIPFYVIRNGPTSIRRDNADDSPDAFTAAQRGQAIVTNQIEVGSIAALRLQKPGGPIKFITADGWEKHSIELDGKQQTCAELRKRADKKGKIFDPDFMKCLISFGHYKAMADQPWKELMTIGKDRIESLPQIRADITPENLPPPANDN